MSNVNEKIEYEALQTQKCSSWIEDMLNPKFLSQEPFNLITVTVIDQT